MTNGEKIKEIFPYMTEQMLEEKLNIFMWWNAEYREPTSKNDLAVDCIVDVLGSYTDLDIPYKREIAENILTKLPSVTPQEPRKGHWINKQRLFDSCSAECSSCHKRSNGYMHDNGFTLVSTYYDFCPKCGSDNREVEE